MPQPPFADSRLKIKRAKKHIADFRRLESRFRKRHPYSLITEENPDPAKTPDQFYVWRLRVNEVAPLETMSLIAGDALHNLRSALDLMACEAVRRNGQSDEDVQFPVCYKPKSLKTAITNRHVERAGRRFVAIVRALKPYKGGHPIIRSLHDLDIIDKHRVRLAAVAGGGIPLMWSGSEQSAGLPYAVFDYVREMEDGAIWDYASRLDVGGGHHVHFDGHIEPSFRIQFGKGIPFEHQPIIPTLDQLASATLQIVEFFEAKL